MPANTDLRAEVLAGIDREIAEVDDCRSCYSAETARTALRHLREIAERHQPQPRKPQGGMECFECHSYYPCPTLLSLAPDYAPQALKEMEVDRG